MSRVRRFVVPAAAVWLFLHVFGVAGTTVLLIATGRGESDLVCTCVHGEDHGTCPMHHKPADAARCRMQSTQSDLGFALLSMLGPLILPVTAATVVVDAASSYRIEYQPPLITHGSLPPEPPPPRS